MNGLLGPPNIIGYLPDGRPVVQNPDGTVSTHIAATMGIDGATYNVPTMYGGLQVDPSQAANIIRQNKMIDPDTGIPLQAYPSAEAAITDYMLRSHPQMDRQANWVRETKKRGLKIKKKK